MRVLWVCFWAIAGMPLAADEPFSVHEKQGMTFVSIPAGQFIMGTSDQDRGSMQAMGWWKRFLESEMPSHRVVIPRPFLIGQTEVTQAQWQAVMGKEAKVVFKGKNRPVESVSYLDVQGFVRKLNESGDDVFRLPTEAEWEYCCRAGDWGLFMIGGAGQAMSVADLPEYCWYKENSGGKTQIVATRQANAWGLYDMLGNVWEWCADTYDRDAYQSRLDPVIAPIGQRPFPERVMRGGSWFLSEAFQRSSVRSAALEKRRSPYIGFRLVCETASVKPEAK